MELDKTITLAASPDAIWKLLLDPTVMGHAVPGMQSIEVVSDTEYLAVMVVKIAFITAKFKLRTLVTEQRAPHYLQSQGTGEDSSVASSLKQTSEIFLTAINETQNGNEPQTELRIKVKAEVLGRLGTFGLSAMKTKADRLWDEFGQNFAAILAASTAVDRGAAQSPVLASELGADTATAPHRNASRILITGAARGLGEAFARAALRSGARVVLTDVLNERGAALALELNAAFDGRAKYLHMDVSDSASVNSAMTEAVTWLGGLDGLVNNAAITNSGGKPMEAIAEDVWDKVMAVNVKGTWLTTVAAKPHLVRASETHGLGQRSEHACGRVVNVASDTAIWGAPNLMAYIASKGAVMAMTHSMARELGEFGVTVNAIAPGLTLGESTEYVPQARHDHYQNGRAIKREQTADDITAAVMFLLSKESGYITGQVLPVNGGFVMN